MSRNALRRVLPLVVCALLLSGCEGLDLLLDIYSVSDLTEDPDPAVQAAGHSAAITEQVEQAETTVQEVLNGDQPPEKLDDLRAVRPQDAKIANYVFWLAMLEGRTGLMITASESARQLHAATVTGDPAEVDRRWLEQNLDVMSDVLNTQAPAPGADPEAVERFAALRTRYCQTLRSYANTYGSSPEGGLYLAFAADQGCGVT